MIRSKLNILFILLFCSFALACEDEKGKINVKVMDSSESLQLPETVEMEEEEMIDPEHTYLRFLPDTFEFIPQKEGFAFMLRLEIHMIQSLVESQREIHFLDHTNEQVNTGKSLENRLFPDMTEHHITTTDLDTAYKANLAYLGEKAEVKWLDLEEINDPAKVSHAKERISIQEKHAGAFEKYGGPLTSILAIIADRPAVWEFSFQNKLHQIVSYRFSDAENLAYSADAATFLISPSQVYPLTGPCSFEKYPVLFLMNEKF
ncbi:MAG: hypothetical protein AAF696_11485, partial [Bacteroidota bacterium]